ncbi:MAG: DinB family protein [Cyclobacteriaceae bacterium]
MSPQETLLSFDESYQRQPWYGESLLKLIDRMTLEDVNFRPTGKTKTAGERLAHIVAWRKLILERLKGNAAFIIKMNTPDDFPGPDTYTAQSWQDLIAELKSTHAELLEWIPKIKDTKAMVRGSKGNDGKPYSYDYLIRGLIEHDIYHQGQMALLVAIVHSS